ncbi:undecaprenyl-diphosphate phosphatase [Candidatus Pacearchaeota archaeon]|nr:undecaprenyl-diphosphate phosphatase [Candidatus Pacearchaeota archaeon]
MFYELLLAIIQAATEFLPISSSGHLAVASTLFGKPNLFFITLLHLASLFAVIIFLRKELISLFSFKKEYRRLWIYWIIATIPAALVGFLFSNLIESLFSSLWLIGIFFIFTGAILLSTRLFSGNKDINFKNSIFIGLFQALAVFPGISRSGMTISSAMFSGIEREKAVKFSFLLFIPLSLGAFVLELIKTPAAAINASIIFAFILCFVLSLVFLNFLQAIIKKNYFWMFSFYCFAVGIVSIVLDFAAL